MNHRNPIKCVVVVLDHENDDLFAMPFGSKDEADAWRASDELGNKKNITVRLVETHPPDLEIDYDT